MIRPGRSAAINRRATSQARMYGPRRFVSRTRSISSVDILWARSASGTPALFTAIVTVPAASSARPTTDTMSSASVMSSRSGTAVPPCAATSVANSSKRSSRLPVGTTVAPAAASTCVNRHPRPEVAPVTRATWPDRSSDT